MLFRQAVALQVLVLSMGQNELRTGFSLGSNVSDRIGDDLSSLKSAINIAFHAKNASYCNQFWITPY
jgi:hypothetical protein